MESHSSLLVSISLIHQCARLTELILDMTTSKFFPTWSSQHFYWLETSQFWKKSKSRCYIGYLVRACFLVRTWHFVVYFYMQKRQQSFLESFKSKATNPIRLKSGFFPIVSLSNINIHICSSDNVGPWILNYFLKFNWKNLFYFYGCFACMNVCVPRGCFLLQILEGTRVPGAGAIESGCKLSRGH
jgi:hypothetical protein